MHVDTILRINFIRLDKRIGTSVIHIVEAQNLPHVIALEVDNKYFDCLCAWGKMGNVIGN